MWLEEVALATWQEGRTLVDVMDFELPQELEAGEPPEARGLRRDQVRLMVSYSADDRVVHAQFHDLPHFLEAGDVVVINTSGTRPSALAVSRPGRPALMIHVSTRLPGTVNSGQWLVEVREWVDETETTKPFRGNLRGAVLPLPAGATVTLHRPYRQGRLWVASFDLPTPLPDYLMKQAVPIRYGYVAHPWPLGYYQTVYATDKESAEMPSAGRAFTPELITQLVAKGIQVVPLALHTGVASLEDHEPPYEEFYRVPAVTAQAVNGARVTGRRVIAVGTTVVRALESVVDGSGRVQAGEGWTDLIITPERGVQVVDGLLTGMHEPKATHLAMLAAVSGRGHLNVAYAEALQEKYLWHEFGDLHLLM